MNVVCLWAFCALVLKLKEVAPLGKLEPNAKFFQQDIPIYRNYIKHKQSVSVDTSDMGVDVLREWAKISGQ